MHAVLAALTRAVGLSVTVVYGGIPQNPQVAGLRDRADIVVACPGRVADLGFLTRNPSRPVRQGVVAHRRLRPASVAAADAEPAVR